MLVLPCCVVCVIGVAAGRVCIPRARKAQRNVWVRRPRVRTCGYAADPS